MNQWMIFILISAESSQQINKLIISQKKQLSIKQSINLYAWTQTICAWLSQGLIFLTL